MNVYLDNSALNRPFDDQAFPTVRLEATAVLLILDLIESSQIRLAASDVGAHENAANPFPERQQWVEAFLDLAEKWQALDSAVAKRAAALERNGLAAIDSLHLASAETAGVDYFLTTDYGILKKYSGELNVVNPVEFIRLIKTL